MVVDDVGNHVRVNGCGDAICFDFLLVSVLLWNVRGLSGEKNSMDESFFVFLMGVNTLRVPHHTQRMFIDLAQTPLLASSPLSLVLSQAHLE